MALRQQADTPADYDDLDLDEYRRNYPAETNRLSNLDIYNIVMSTEDDLDPDEWRRRFTIYNG